MTSATPTTDAPRRATAREWLGLAVLALPCLLLSLDMSVLYLALPGISLDLQPSATETLWILDIYGFMIAGFLVTMGTLGDRIGRRRLLLIGGAAFGLASVLAAFSTSSAMLIASRAVLGIAGATLMPSTLALISNMFPDEKQRGTAIAVWMTAFMGGIAVGPVVGGLMLGAFWWGSVFLLGVPVMLVLLIAGPLLLPEFRDPAAGRLDLVSVVVFLGAILPVVYGIKEAAVHGVTSVGIAAFVFGAIAAAVFVRRQTRLAHPLLDLALFRVRAFRASLGIMILTCIFMAGLNLLVSQYFQLVEGFTPLRAGLLLLPAVVVSVVSTFVGTALAPRIGPGRVLAAGALIAVVGTAMLTQVGVGGSIGLIVAAFSLINLGLGPIGALCTNLVVGSAPPERAGAASASSETSAELGVALGVTVFGSITAAIYRGRLADDAPSGIPAETVAAAREGLAGAVQAAGTLPGPTGAGLLLAAREAFVAGLVVVAILTAIALIVVAVVSFLTLRDEGGSPEVAAPVTDPELSHVSTASERPVRRRAAVRDGAAQRGEQPSGRSASLSRIG